MEEVDMLRSVKKSIVAVTCVLESMKEDITLMEESMDKVKDITNSWKTLLQDPKYV